MHDIAITGIYFFFIALLYSTVGHAGASGYLATMALLSFPPGVMKPTALALNIIVALVTSIRFYQAGHFSWRLFWPFALASVPLAYLGGSLAIHTTAYKILVGIALLFAAVHFILRNKVASDQEEGINQPAMFASLATGGIIGFISGLTGVGGGIFLSPVLIILHWAGLRRTAAVAAVFILFNSLSGLAGYLQKGGALPEHIALWSVAVVSGGLIGSSLGATKLNSPVLRILLGIVLVMAGMKLVI
ncbi:MAG: sulfite exporter TauE/SafE family protein [Betaproteobacteria bacterium]